MGVSAGPWGGTRVIESMVPMVRELGLTVTFSDLNFPSVRSKFDADGKVNYHRDYWDTGEELYMKLPGLGTLMRGLRRVLAA